MSELIRSEQTTKNHAGEVVAKLYFNTDGNLHPDSWIKDYRNIQKTKRDDLGIGDIVKLKNSDDHWVISDDDNDYDQIFHGVNISGGHPIKDQIFVSEIECVIEKR